MKFNKRIIRKELERLRYENMHLFTFVKELLRWSLDMQDDLSQCDDASEQAVSAFANLHVCAMKVCAKIGDYEDKNETLSYKNK